MLNFDGVVWLRGVVTGAANGNSVLTVPAAYCPASTITFTAVGMTSAALLSNATYNPVVVSLSKAGVLTAVYSSAAYTSFLDLGMLAYTLS